MAPHLKTFTVNKLLYQNFLLSFLMVLNLHVSPNLKIEKDPRVSLFPQRSFPILPPKFLVLNCYRLVQDRQTKNVCHKFHMEFTQST